MRLIHILLDESGSMSNGKGETIKSYNDYLDSLPDDNVELTLTLFNSARTAGQHKFLIPSEAPRLTEENYRPAANTPLYDAIAHVIRQTEEFSREREKATGTIPPVLVVVLTDGMENASTEYDLEKIQAYMGEMEKTKQWEFAYLGVGPDGWAEKNLAAYVHTNSAIRGQTVSASDTTAAFGATTSISTEYLARRIE